LSVEVEQVSWGYACFVGSNGLVWQIWVNRLDAAAVHGKL